MKDDILDTKEIGTSRRAKAMSSAVKAPHKQESSSKKPNLKRDVQRLINWVDNNVLPLIALVVIAGLATKGLQIFLPEMNETTRTVASILAVAVLVVKLKAGRV